MAVLHYTVRCYREVPGDADCHDVPAFADTMDQMVELAGQMLRAYATRADRAPRMRPLRADLVDQAGAVVGRIRLAGPRIERVVD
ncbi:MAG TPA: hypothetical protein VFK86_17645 [Bauldia sp.]|nr:hypothetical protein [Bauldia sp.]